MKTTKLVIAFLMAAGLAACGGKAQKSTTPDTTTDMKPADGSGATDGAAAPADGSGATEGSDMAAPAGDATGGDAAGGGDPCGG